MRSKGNRVRIPSDPVTVSADALCKMPLPKGEKACRAREAQARKPADAVLMSIFRRKPLILSPQVCYALSRILDEPFPVFREMAFFSSLTKFREVEKT